MYKREREREGERERERERVMERDTHTEPGLVCIIKPTVLLYHINKNY